MTSATTLGSFGFVQKGRKPETDASLEDQHTLIELIQRRLAERRRSEIAHNATVTLQAVRGGRARQGSLDDLKHDLLAEP